MNHVNSKQETRTAPPFDWDHFWDEMPGNVDEGGRSGSCDEATKAVLDGDTQNTIERIRMEGQGE